MNFIRSSQTYHSTDVSHVDEVQSYSNRQEFGGCRPRFYNPGQSNLIFNRPRGFHMGSRGRGLGYHGNPNSRFGGPRGNTNQNVSGPRPSFAADGGREGQPHESCAYSTQASSSNMYKGFVKQEQTGDSSQVVKQEPQASGVQYGGFAQLGSSDSQATRRPGLGSAASFGHPYNRQQAPLGRARGRYLGGGDEGGPMRGGRDLCSGAADPGAGSRFGNSGKRGAGGSSVDLVKIEAATKAAARATKEAANPHAKCIVLSTDNIFLTRFRRLAEEIPKLKTKRPNAIDSIHSASNIVQVKIQCEVESGPVVRGTFTFFCLVQFDGINIAVGSGLNKRAAKLEAFELALQKLNKPYKRIVEIDGTTKEFQASDYDFAAEEPKQTVVKPTSAVVADISGDDGVANIIQKESNAEALMDGRKNSYEPKDLQDFVIVEPQEHNSSTNGASILRRSADFSKMLLEYDFAPSNCGAVRCVCKVEGQILADCVGTGKVMAKNKASQQAIDELRKCCYTILTKQHCDSEAPEITKDDMFNDFASNLNANAVSMSKPIGDSNLGKKLLQKMGWTGGGIGKDGDGIEEPVTMQQVINREGLGLGTHRGVAKDFQMRVTELLESYASSDRQEDLVFSPQFRLEERMIIHNQCRRLSLKSKSKGTGSTRFLVIRRKRSVFQLLSHLLEIGGESPRYKVVPPGQRIYPWPTFTHSATASTDSSPSKANPGAAAAKSSSSAGPGHTGPSPTANKHNPSAVAGFENPNAVGGLFGQNLTKNILSGQNAGGLLGQNPSKGQPQTSGLSGQNHGSGLMGQSQPSRAAVSQNFGGFMSQNPAVSQNQMSGFMNQNFQMGQNQWGSFGSDASQNRGMYRGQTSDGFSGQNQSPGGFMGQDQNSGGFVGQNQNIGGVWGQGVGGFTSQKQSRSDMTGGYWQ